MKQNRALRRNTGRETGFQAGQDHICHVFKTFTVPVPCLKTLFYFPVLDPVFLKLEK